MSFEIAVSRTLGEATISAEFRSGPGLTAIQGPSGAGKTSILNMVAGLLRPDRGRISVGGEILFDSEYGIDVPVEQRRAGYVFQDERLFPHRRVRENLLYGWTIARPESRWLSLAEAMGILGIGPLMDRWPHTLSGGEARRVAIGRALLSGPRFLLMDEPLTSLDPPRREEIMQVIERIRASLSLPILYVSHDRDEVERLATETVTLG